VKTVKVEDSTRRSTISTASRVAGVKVPESGGAGHLVPGYPNGCIECGETDRKHYCGGRCTRCYTNARNARLAREHGGARMLHPTIASEPTASTASESPTDDLTEPIRGALAPEVFENSIGEQPLCDVPSDLCELRDRNIVRTGNALTGDYAEYLAARYTGGELEPNSAKGYDVKAGDGVLYQVKSRMVDAGSGSASSHRFALGTSTSRWLSSLTMTTACGGHPSPSCSCTGPRKAQRTRKRLDPARDRRSA
jgi:hypothetical protein